MNTHWFKPLKWARNGVFMVLLAIDFKHTYEFIMSISLGAQAREPVILFGPLFAHFGIPMTNSVFDAMAYAFAITATIYFVSNTLAHRLSHNHPSGMFYFALGIGVAVSALTNAGTMFYAATGDLIILPSLLGWVAAGLGGIITAGLLMFASMDAWDMKARVEKAAATRTRNQQLRDQARFKDTTKFTPKKYRKETEGATA